MLYVATHRLRRPLEALEDGNSVQSAADWVTGTDPKSTRLRPKKENSLDPLVKTAALARASLQCSNLPRFPGARQSDTMQTHILFSKKKLIVVFKLQ